MTENGNISILINSLFSNYVKLWDTKNVNESFSISNRSECIPFVFRVYVTYEVVSCLSDKKPHDIIDKFNPDLRSIEKFNRKQRKREFYVMSSGEANSLLKSKVTIYGYGKTCTYRTDSTVKQEEAVGV